MSIKTIAYSVLLVGTLCSSFHQALAQDAAVKPHVPLAKTIGEVNSNRAGAIARRHQLDGRDFGG